MDLLTVGVVLGLVALGGVIVWWPLSLEADSLRGEIDRLKRLGDAASGAIQTERRIDAARDLAPLDELGVLLGKNNLPGTKAGRESVP
jgi:hypothetical protein